MSQAALLNFAPVADGDPQRPAGSCSLCGLPAIASFDLASDPATVTVRFEGQVSGDPLPPAAQGLSEISISGAAVAVGPVRLSSGTEALRGTVDPAAISPDPPPPTPSPAPAAGVDPGAAPDRLVELSTQLAAARAEHAGHVAGVKDLRLTIAGLQDRLATAERELSVAGDTASEHAESCAELRQQIRDLLDAEETA